MKSREMVAEIQEKHRLSNFRKIHEIFVGIIAAM